MSRFWHIVFGMLWLLLIIWVIKDDYNNNEEFKNMTRSDHNDR